MNVDRDPQNGYRGAIENAVTGGLNRVQVDRGSEALTGYRHLIVKHVSDAVMSALDLSDDAPEGVWLAYFTDVSDIIKSVHLEEIDALREAVSMSYKVKFVKFGDDLLG